MAEIISLKFTSSGNNAITIGCLEASFDVRVLTLQVLRIQLEYYDSSEETREPTSATVTTKEGRSSPLRYGILAGAAVVASVGVLVYLKRSKT